MTGKKINKLSKKTKLLISCGLFWLIIGPTAQALTAADPLVGNQWYLKRIGADKAWALQTNSPEVVIAVIDTGVMIEHPDLRNNIWLNPKEVANNNLDDDHNGYVDDANGWDFVNNVPNVGPKFQPGYTEDGINHGTVIAGVLAAESQNGLGVAGVTGQAKIMALKALDDAGEADMKSVVKAINYAVDNGAKIINLSFVGSHTSAELEKAVIKAKQAGVIIVAAGGNDLAGGEGQNLNKNPLYPVCSDQQAKSNLIVGVAAVGPLDDKASFSGFGSCIDITAPGVSIFSTAVYKTEVRSGEPFSAQYDGYWSGTSFAVPMVSATLALMMQANPSLTPAQLVSLLLRSSDYNYGVNQSYLGQLGAGRLNTLMALQAVQARKEEEKVNILLFNDSETKGLVKRVTAKGVVKAKFNTFDNAEINVAAGDFNGDKKTEIAVAPKKGLAPEVRIYDENGKLLKKFLAFESNFLGGVSLAAGDFNNDGLDELIVARAGLARPEVRLLDKNFKIKKSWLAYAPTFGGGVNLAVGDVNNDGKKEIVCSPAANGGPHIRIFTAEGRLLNHFFAMDEKIRSGYKVAVADAYSSLNKINYLAIAAGPGQTPHLHLINYRGELIRRFGAYNLSFAGGINVAAADLDNDGQAEIIAGAGAGAGPHLMFYKNSGYLTKAFYTDKKSLTQGVEVAVFINK